MHGGLAGSEVRCLKCGLSKPDQAQHAQSILAGCLARREVDEREKDPAFVSDAYAECYPEYHGYNATIVDDEADYSHMDSKFGKGRTDFQTEEEWQVPFICYPPACGACLGHARSAAAPASHAGCPVLLMRMQPPISQHLRTCRACADLGRLVLTIACF